MIARWGKRMEWIFQNSGIRRSCCVYYYGIGRNPSPLLFIVPILFGNGQRCRKISGSDGEPDPLIKKTTREDRVSAWTPGIVKDEFPAARINPPRDTASDRHPYLPPGHAAFSARRLMYQ